MSVSAFVPSSVTVYRGVRVPENAVDLKPEDLNSLIGEGNWRFARVARVALAESEAPFHVEIDQPWGPSQAHPTDYILRGPDGVSIVPFTVFRSLRLNEIKDC